MKALDLKLEIGFMRKHGGDKKNAGNQQFLFFLQCFQKTSCLGLLKVGIVWHRVCSLPTYREIEGQFAKVFEQKNILVSSIVFFPTILFTLPPS